MVTPCPSAKLCPPDSILFEKTTSITPELAAAAWKWSPRLAVNVHPVTLIAVILAVPDASTRKPSLPMAELLLNVLEVTVREVKLPVLLRITTLSSAEPVTVVPDQVEVPNKLLISTPASPAALPFPDIEELVNVKFVTELLRIPSSLPFWMIKLVKLTSRVLVSMTPAPEEFWIVPPEPAVPFPRILSPPKLGVVPVLFSTMPLVAPLDEMLRNSRLFVPMLVLTTFSAVPVVVLMVFGFVPVVTVTVPPPVAVNPVPLVVSMSNPPPVKLMVAPVLVLRFTAVFAPVLSVFVPPENV